MTTRTGQRLGAAVVATLTLVALALLGLVCRGLWELWMRHGWEVRAVMLMAPAAWLALYLVARQGVE